MTGPDDAARLNSSIFESWDKLPEETREKLKAGDAALGNIERAGTRERWDEICDSALALQMEAMAEAGTDRTDTPEYRKTFAPLAEHLPHLRDMDKGFRSKCIWRATTRPEVDPWLQADPKRIRLKNPGSIKNAHDRAQRKASDKASPANPNPAPGAPPDEHADCIAEKHEPEYICQMIDRMVSGLSPEQLAARPFRTDAIKAIARAEAAEAEVARLRDKVGQLQAYLARPDTPPPKRPRAGKYGVNVAEEAKRSNVPKSTLFARLKEEEERKKQEEAEKADRQPAPLLDPPGPPVGRDD
jgi:hypothetical protein